MVDTEGNEGSRTEGAVGSDLYTLLLDPLDQNVLLEVGMEFNYEGKRKIRLVKAVQVSLKVQNTVVTRTLENSGLDLGIGQEVHEELDVEVGDTNVASNAVFNQLLQLRPALVEGSTVKGNLVLTRLEPLRGIGSIVGNVLQGNGDYRNRSATRIHRMTQSPKHVTYSESNKDQRRKG